MNAPPVLNPAPRRAPVCTLGSALRWLGHDGTDRHCLDPTDFLIAPIWFIPRGQHTANTFSRHPVGKGVLGLLLSHAESLRLRDLTAHFDAVGFREHHPPMGALLGVPINIRQTVLGSVYPTAPASRPASSQADETAVNALASAAAMAIDNARLFDWVRSTARWTKASRAIATALLSGVDPHVRSLQPIADRACELFRAEQGQLRSEHNVLGVTVVARHIDQAPFEPKMSAS